MIGKQIFRIHDEDFGEAMKIFFSAAVLQQLEQAGDAADTRVRNHLVFLSSRLLRGGGSVRAQRSASSGCVMIL